MGVLRAGILTWIQRKRAIMTRKAWSFEWLRRYRYVRCIHQQEVLVV
jgi:hypothetical protein